jgi:hypothetical protein
LHRERHFSHPPFTLKLLHNMPIVTMDWLGLTPPLPPSLCSLFSTPSPELTGQVTKSESYCFDHGGNADIWQGKWVKKDSGYVEAVQTYLPARWPFPFLKLRLLFL